MREIKISLGKFAIVDDDEYEWLSQYNWNAVWNGRSFYARRRLKINGKWGYSWMHREIMKTPKDLQVDHINKNTLDNRKCNLRNCTPTQNVASKISGKNETGFRGVLFWKSNPKIRHYKPQAYVARIKIDKKIFHIGTFHSAEEAARAYDKKAREVHGEFAVCNFQE